VLVAVDRRGRRIAEPGELQTDPCWWRRSVRSQLHQLGFLCQLQPNLGIYFCKKIFAFRS